MVEMLRGWQPQFPLHSDNPKFGCHISLNNLPIGVIHSLISLK